MIASAGPPCRGAGLLPRRAHAAGCKARLRTIVSTGAGHEDRNPMTLSLDEVRRIAVLARLKLSPEEERLFQGQLSAILDYVEQLKELDVTGIEPMTHALAAGERPALREDVVRPSLPPEDALANAPGREGTCFKVPRIIE